MMSDHDEAFATRVREVLDVVGSAVPRADGEHWPPQHADRPAARPGRWLAVAAAVVLVAVGVWALVSRGSETSPVTPDTTVTLPSTSTTTAQQRIIATWVDRATGQTTAYEMDLSCFCSATGKWSVVERDGTVLQAEYLGDGEPDRPTPQLLMTRGLQLAATANGPVLVSGDDTTLQLSADVDVDSIDDEFGFTITNFRVLTNYPQGAPTGPKVNYQLAGQLALVRGPEGTTPVSGAVRAVDPRDGTIVTYAATNDDGTFSLYVPAGTYRLVGITPQYEAGQIQCQLDNITVPQPDATSLLLGCPRPVPPVPETTATTPTTCVVPPPDRAPQRDECTLVDWDALSTDGDTIRLIYYVNPGCTADLDRVDIDESALTVTLNVVVGFNGDGDGGATCGTDVAQATTSVTLASPLGSRKLLGCRPVGSFVPEGGYNDQAPRDPDFDCRPKG